MWRAGLSKSAPTHHAAYLVIAALAAEQIALGHHVVVDAVNGPEMARAQWRDLAVQTNADLKWIVVECSDDRIFRDRLAHRIRPIEGFGEPSWKAVIGRRATFPPWTDDRLRIDSVNSRDANLQAALEYLQGA
jgi:predicted kinase